MYLWERDLVVRETRIVSLGRPSSLDGAAATAVVLIFLRRVVAHVASAPGSAADGRVVVTDHRRCRETRTTPRRHPVSKGIIRA
jgi:hypothetical protein